MGHLITFKARTYVTGQAERQSTLTIYPVIGEPAPRVSFGLDGRGRPSPHKHSPRQGRRTRVSAPRKLLPGIMHGVGHDLLAVGCYFERKFDCLCVALL